MTKWYQYLICFIFIVTGIFSGIYMSKVWSETSGVYGSISSIETQNNYSVVAKFDYGTIPFDTEDYSTYSNYRSWEHIDFDGKSADYVVLFNDNMLSDVFIYDGKISGTCTLKFYGTDGSVVCSAVLNIRIEFLEDRTDVLITTTNSNNEIGYLNYYMNTNGSILKVVTRGGV